MNGARRHRLGLPCLMLVTDRHLAGGVEPLVRAVARAVEGGVNAVQLREKDLPSRELLALTKRLREITPPLVPLLVNGPLEVALEGGADGVHLPADKPMIGRPQRPFLVGRSVHSVEAADRAQGEGADYLIAGAVYETSSHPGRERLGVGLIESIAATVTIPVLAIGGINPTKIAEIMRSGASGVAVVSAILNSTTPGDAAGSLSEALKAAVCRPGEPGA